MARSDRTMAGMLLFSAMVVFVMGLNLAEMLYPGYSVSSNYISDLGATCSGDSCRFVQPSAAIFDSSVFLSGLMVVIAAYYFRCESRRSNPAILILFAGFGAMGVGIFPEDAGLVHLLAAYIVFIFGGLSSVAAYKMVQPPLRYLSALLGIVASASLILFVSHNYMGLGPGGLERLIVYPFVLAALGFSGYLMHS